MENTTTQEITIEEIPWERWKDYKDISLHAIALEAIAFIPTYEELDAQSDDYWINELKNRENIKLLFAIDNKATTEEKTLVGMIGVKFNSYKKLLHNATLLNFYVRPGYRKKKIGTKLINEVLTQIRSNPEITRIGLYVTSNQVAAINLYKHLGFTICGTHKNYMYWKGNYYDIYHMELFITPQTDK